MKVCPNAKDWRCQVAKRDYQIQPQEKLTLTLPLVNFAWDGDIFHDPQVRHWGHFFRLGDIWLAGGDIPLAGATLQASTPRWQAPAAAEGVLLDDGERRRSPYIQDNKPNHGIFFYFVTLFCIQWIISFVLIVKQQSLRRNRQSLLILQTLIKKHSPPRTT